MKDHLASAAALGLLAYLGADLAHHALGHGGACLATGGQILLLNAVFLDCTLRGSAIDLAGPLANLLAGLACVLVLRVAPRTPATARLFLLLSGAFNLMWFGLQLSFSVATRSDDWAWAMQEFHVARPLRWGAIALGALAYLMTVRWLGTGMAPFAQPRSRAWRILAASWLGAIGVALATAAADPHASTGTLWHALSQSLVLPVGLLFVPSRAAREAVPERCCAALDFSLPLAIAALLAGTLSVACLGPGISLAQ